jgi:hypothetical protein
MYPFANFCVAATAHTILFGMLHAKVTKQLSQPDEQGRLPQTVATSPRHRYGKVIGPPRGQPDGDQHHGHAVPPQN